MDAAQTCVHSLRQYALQAGAAALMACPLGPAVTSACVTGLLQRLRLETRNIGMPSEEGSMGVPGSEAFFELH